MALNDLRGRLELFQVTILMASVFFDSSMIHYIKWPKESFLNFVTTTRAPI